MTAAKQIFGTDGIRAVANAGPLALEEIVRLGRAIGKILEHKPELFGSPKGKKAGVSGVRTEGVFVARDTRRSGPMIQQALAAALAAGGIRVIDGGILPTPAVSLLTRKFGYQLGVVISASHNPATDNGIKFFAANGMKLTDDQEVKIEAVLSQITRKPPAGDEVEVAPILSQRNARELYLQETLRLFPQSLQGLKLIVDCANGATFRTAPPLLQKLGAQVKVLNDKPDGLNINAECGVGNLPGLCQAVKSQPGHIGIAFDGDGDRLIMVDEQAEVRDGDFLLALLAHAMHEQKKLPNGRVVSTVMSNLALEMFIREMGGELVRTQVGDKYVFEEMLSSGSVLGGEQSGHLVFLEHETTGDGLWAALRVLGLMAMKKKPLSALAPGYKKLPQFTLSVPVSSKPEFDSVEKIREKEAVIRERLGNRGRILLRYSGTEPLARIMVEGENEQEIRRYTEELAETVWVSLQ